MSQKVRKPMNFDVSKPVWQSQLSDLGNLVRVSASTQMMPGSPLMRDRTPSVLPTLPEKPMLTLKSQVGRTLSRETVTEQIKNYFQK